MVDTKDVEINAGKAVDVEYLPEVVEDEDGKGALTNYDLVDSEVAQYASETIVEVDEETNARLKRLIDRRVLSVMVFTYFIQALVSLELLSALDACL